MSRLARLQRLEAQAQAQAHATPPPRLLVLEAGQPRPADLRPQDVVIWLFYAQAPPIAAARP